MPSQATVVATVVSLQVCPGRRQPMQPVASVQAVENLGLAGDLHARPDSQRQVLFIEAETLDKLGLEVGQVKENVTTRGIALTALPAGARLRVGEAVFEITQPCEPCSRMEELRPGLQQTLEGQRGMLARVVQGGALHVGDAIQIL